MKKNVPEEGGKRIAWLDDSTGAPLIDGHARRLTTYLQAVADGVVDAAEMKQQENRVAELMREIEPRLDDALHAKVTELLCELTAYDLMQVLHSIQESRPKTKFRG